MVFGGGNYDVRSRDIISFDLVNSIEFHFNTLMFARIAYFVMQFLSRVLEIGIAIYND